MKLKWTKPKLFILQIKRTQNGNPGGGNDALTYTGSAGS